MCLPAVAPPLCPGSSSLPLQQHRVEDGTAEERLRLAGRATRRRPALHDGGQLTQRRGELLPQIPGGVADERKSAVSHRRCLMTRTIGITIIIKGSYNDIISAFRAVTSTFLFFIIIFWCNFIFFFLNLVC